MLEASKAILYSDLRANLKFEFDTIVQNNCMLKVVRKSGGNVVIMSEEDFNSIQETLYLTSSKKNRERLDSAIADDETFTLEEVKDEIGF